MDVKCLECGKWFTLDSNDEEGQDVCYECELALIREYAPELLGNDEEGEWDERVPL